MEGSLCMWLSNTHLQTQHGVSAVVPHVTSAVNRTLAFVGEHISVLRYTSGGTVQDYIAPVVTKAYDKVSPYYTRYD